jgi:tetratricopeptide (TPR) repeat protein
MVLQGCAFTGKPPLSPLEKKLAQEPLNRDVNLQLARDAEYAGDWLRAEQYYRRVEALGAPEEQVLPALLRVLVAARRYNEALARCHQRLTTAPDDRTTRYVEAVLLVALGRTREAAHDLAILIKQKPDDAQPYLDLGQLYRDVKDERRANAMFARYLELAPKSAAATTLRLERSEPDADPLLPDPDPAPPAPSAQ